MVENIDTVSTVTRESIAVEQPRLKVTVFHCFNAIKSLDEFADINFVIDITGIKMPCSSITREVFLLRAFEAGADAVIVIVCPKGHCRYIEGNARAEKRVARIKKLLDEIGLDGRRLNIYHLPEEDHAAFKHAVSQVMDDLTVLGPSPVSCMPTTE